jgi:hypothetical protein
VIEVKLADAEVRVSGLRRRRADRRAVYHPSLGIGRMINFPDGARVVLAIRPVYFRKGTHTLAAFAQ